ncbi:MULTISPECIES: SRPBCC family protein [unclassified Nocardioides]|uniref:SRPBCC family protein n=1 Tax=unclassified Nocardioides TaxID=2615069 RepID=UPI0026652899|nr:SRPBCC family protein [Nocardioides sp. Arc9.136]WKN48335.1 SRPBCC family protein [Nocardioides sp. Arc9.136]
MTDPELRVSATEIVSAPPETVFAILADPRQHPRIDGSGTVRGSVSGPERLGLGATFGMSMKMGAPYRIRNKVVEFEEGRLIAWKHLGSHRWRYELEPVDLAGRPGTRVTETWDGTYYNRLGRAAMKRLGMPEKNRRGIEGTLPRLKAAAEEDADA